MRTAAAAADPEGAEIAQSSVEKCCSAVFLTGLDLCHFAIFREPPHDVPFLFLCGSRDVLFPRWQEMIPRKREIWSYRFTVARGKGSENIGYRLVELFVVRG